MENCLRFVIFYAQQDLAWLKNVRQDADTFDDLRRAVLHQAVICCNVRLAFSGVNDQRFNFISAALQFNAGGKTCATQSGDAELMNTRNQLFPAAGR
jgi:precorrin isomerase